MGKYTLIITEKPDAARRIAEALDFEGKPKKVDDKTVPYFIANRDKPLVIVPALGHLYTVVHAQGGRNYYPVFNFKWAPRYAAEKGAKQIKTWIEVISKLAENADSFIDACVSPETIILTKDSENLTIADLEECWQHHRVLGFDEHIKSISDFAIKHYMKLNPIEIGRHVFKLTTESGRSICATDDHRFYSPKGWVPLKKLKPNDKVAVYPYREPTSLDCQEQTLVKEEDIWRILSSLLSERSKRPHNRYRYDRQQYFKVIKLRERGLTYKKISEETGLTLRTVRRWLSEKKIPYTVRNPSIERLKKLGLLPLSTKHEKIDAIMRLLGAVFGDGCLYASKKKWYAKGAVFMCEISGGVEEIESDLRSLGFNYIRENRERIGFINGRKFRQKCQMLICNSLALWLLLYALGAPAGAKTDVSYEIPRWLFTSPPKLQREFLSTMLGGDLVMPRVSDASPRSFSMPDFRFNKLESLRNNGERLADQITTLLGNFRVTVSSISVRPSGIQRRDGAKTVSIRLMISNSRESLHNLFHRIGINYCTRKKKLGQLISEYQKLKNNQSVRKIPKFKDWVRTAIFGLGNSGLIWEKVQSIVPVQCSDVRDITISKVHNFIANGFLTHNCDYDIEGAIIGYTILKYACHDKDNLAKRMKYSTLTKPELEKSYEEMMPTLDFAMIEAGKTRHEVDWLYGVNISRALTLAANRWSGKYATLSTGRVQGPTLKFLVARERSIHSFVPTPYWSILAEVEIQGAKYSVDFEKKVIEKKADVDAIVEACKGKIGRIEKIEEKSIQVTPPVPFDLGSLQSEAYSLFGYTPRRTGDIAERLYLEALISYPRTSSQKLPPVINYKAILSGLSQEPAYQKLASELLGKDELKPKEGPKTDPAHPAVYPTGNRPERVLDESERRIWDLIVRRFMAVFGESGVKQSMKASININGHRFYLRGRRILKEGWMKFYKPYLRTEEVSLPPIKEGETIQLVQIRREDKFTQPPPRYNPGSLLKRMEHEGIGTKATRADIIETLYDRKYITEERIVVTDVGFNVTEVLRKYAPSVISVKLTRDLEEKMERIQSSNEKRENILLEVVERLKPMLAELKKSEEIIGETLNNAIKQARMQERTIGECPNCHTGKLMILFSRRTKKRFIGCTNYFKNACKTSFPLPQRGTAKPTGKFCKGCGWPLLFVHIRGKRPWNLCFNPACPKKEERRKRLEMQNMQQGSSDTNAIK